MRSLPPGITPPNILRYNASTVPILRLALSSASLTEQELYDFGNNFLKTQLATVPGASAPLPYGGKQRQIMVDIDSRKLQERNLSPLDVVNAVSAQNLILPSGTAKIGSTEYSVEMNGSPDSLAGLNNIPIRSTANGTVYIRDVAHVRDGFQPQTNIVRVNGQRASLLTINKSGNTSTLDIVDRIKTMMPTLRNLVPASLNIDPVADQSLFVRASVQGVLREALIAACLTGLMILLFLGNWRATLIIAVSIPLSMITSIIALSILGETINIMTLGGLALAVGHSGRRRDGRDRKHQPSTGTGQDARTGDSRRRAPDRDSDAGVDPVHLHRVRADVSADRRRALSVRAARRSGGVRDARVVFLLAHAGADAREIPAALSP